MDGGRGLCACPPWRRRGRGQAQGPFPSTLPPLVPTSLETTPSDLPVGAEGKGVREVIGAGDRFTLMSPIAADTGEMQEEFV